MPTPSERYWHGGVPGLAVGDLLLPPDTTGTSNNLAQFSRDRARADRVHLTTERGVAKAYAAAYPGGYGALYVAEPLGEIDPDPDAPEVSIRCGSARITQVYDPVVRWAERGDRWLAPLLREEAAS